MPPPLADDGRGNLLLAFRTGPESDLAERDAGVPLPLALVVGHHAGEVALVHGRRRRSWELPGGLIEDGETPAAAAAREFAEETGQPVPPLAYVGVATFRLAPDDRLERAAVYAGPVPRRVAFVANDEADGLQWWDGAVGEGLAPLDAAIARLAMGWSA